MPRYIAFLRGINLGQRRLPMSRLKDAFEELEFTEVATFIASGNVLFSCKGTNTSRLELRIAKQLETSLGYPVDTFVRTAAEVTAISRARIFPEAGQAGVTIHVSFWHQSATADFARQLAAVRTDEDEFRVTGREFYWLCRVRTSDSKVWSLPAIKALPFPTSTMRNMTSIRKLVAQHLG